MKMIDMGQVPVDTFFDFGLAPLYLRQVISRQDALDGLVSSARCPKCGGAVKIVALRFTRIEHRNAVLEKIVATASCTHRCGNRDVHGVRLAEDRRREPTR